MAAKEAKARIKINKLLEEAGWRFFDGAGGKANVALEPNVKLSSVQVDALGENFEETGKGFIDFLLLDESGFPLVVLEAKAEDKNPLIGKEQARKYAKSQNCRFVILSNGNLHYFWDLQQGNPHLITRFPGPASIKSYHRFQPNPQKLITDLVGKDYIALTQMPGYASAVGWNAEAERPAFIEKNRLRFMRDYQKRAVQSLQDAAAEGKSRFLFEMATGTGKTLTAAAVIKLFLRTGNARRVLFLVDRLELEDQANKTFIHLLKNDYTSVIYKERRDDWRKAEIVVTTVQSLLFNDKYRRLFSPTDFDLVISDEAHRSIGGNARAVFEYFVGYKLGLTATPKDYLKRFSANESGKNATTRDPREAERRLLLDTYRTFGCESGDPTFRYGLLDGVRDGYLINPALFRDIFKNAYLPYRDPETLRSFLKEIDFFNYDHSEKLGDAFEYLLSVLGSQGDAGQFRTPRHIIDFMVEVVDPKKNESILDPACGTAGFLISAWKHILKQNSSPRPLAGEGSGERAGDLLTPAERKRLATNIRGYDISPDMVRLSLVNMYLHGFPDPHIVEYDTLTSEEKWNETADVILANPPFMSPKGGIKPHKRFSIQAKRSEVLFVDYMAEHLTPTGRAAIIVPEGIIFQSQTAYKALRKLLVSNSLVAVVSLPAGCFNPYAGVKTSILILDKSLARKSESIAFFKVDNDGFGLGAQRRAIDKNDLPQVKAELAAYLQALRKQQATADLQPTCGLIVVKEKIAANGDYNLSGERYRESGETKQKFSQVELGTICKPEYGFTASAADAGDARFVRITDISPDGRIRKDEPKFIKLTHESEPYLLKKGDLLVARTGATFGKTMLFDEEYPAVFASYLIRLRFPQDILLPEFYWAFAQSEKYWEQARNLASGGGQPQFNGNALTQIKIPLPPLEVQKEIVAEIEGHQNRIEELKQEIAENEAKIKLTLNRIWGEMDGSGSILANGKETVHAHN